jgi:hypothetical protein
MNEKELYNLALAELRAKKPLLTGFFLSVYEQIAKFSFKVKDAASAAKKLAYASEYLYFNFETLLPRLVSGNEADLFADIVYRLSTHDSGIANTFLRYYPSLKFPLVKIHNQLICFCENAAKKMKQPEKALASAFSTNDPATCSFLLGNWSVIAHYSPATLLECVSVFEGIAKTVRWETASAWMLRGIDLLTSGRTDEGIRFLLLRAKESRAMLGINLVGLDDMRSRLKIYSASLSGYDMSILSTELSLYGIGRTYTDGASIFLPDTIDYFKEPVYNERVYAALAALQAASVMMGSFSLDLSKIGFKDALRERYGMLLPKITENVAKQYKGIAKSIRERQDGELEVVFGNDRRVLVLNTEHEKLFYSFPTPDFAKELFAIIENLRIETSLGRSYPGLMEDFALLDSFLWKKRPQVRIDTTSNKAARFLGCIECLVQYSLVGKYKADIPDPAFGRIMDSIRVELDKIKNPESTVQDTASVLFSVYNIFFDNFPLVAFCSKFDVRDRFTGTDKPGFFPEIVADAAPGLMKENAKSDFSDAAADNGNQAIDLTSMRDADKKSNEVRDSIASGDLRLYRYPEYNYLKSAYEKNHCTLFETKAKGSANYFYTSVMRDYMQIHKRIKKRFLYMKPDELEISRRWLAGDDIDISDALDYSIALVRGESPDEKVYYRKIKDSRDVSVAILVDASSSTDTTVEGSRVIDIEKAALALLASALDIVGDPFAVYSFNSQGRNRVFFNVIKDFAENWDSQTQSRIGALSPNASNRDGCAIRHATAKLNDEDAKTRLLILLSDGIPADIDYGSTSSSETSEYAIEDTRRALIESRKLGVIPFCLTIDRFAKKYIARLYGDYHYALLSDVRKLPERLSQLYLRLTR